MRIQPLKVTIIALELNRTAGTDDIRTGEIKNLEFGTKERLLKTAQLIERGFSYTDDDSIITAQGNQCKVDNLSISFKKMHFKRNLKPRTIIE